MTKNAKAVLDLRKASSLTDGTMVAWISENSTSKVESHDRTHTQARTRQRTAENLDQLFDLVSFPLGCI